MTTQPLHDNPPPRSAVLSLLGGSCSSAHCARATGNNAASRPCTATGFDVACPTDGVGELAPGPGAFAPLEVTAHLRRVPGHGQASWGSAGWVVRFGLHGRSVGNADACIEGLPVLAVLSRDVLPDLPGALTLDLHLCNVAVVLRDRGLRESNLGDFSELAKELLDLLAIQGPHSFDMEMEGPALGLLHGLEQRFREGVYFFYF